LERRKAARNGSSSNHLAQDGVKLERRKANKKRKQIAEPTESTHLEQDSVNLERRKANKKRRPGTRQCQLGARKS